MRDLQGKYEVTPDGRVFSLGYNHTGRRRELSYLVVPNGYVQVMLYLDGKRKPTYVHRLVAFAFVPNPHNKPNVNHLDFNRKNNNKENLEWVTQAENCRHAAAAGRTSWSSYRKIGELNARS